MLTFTVTIRTLQQRIRYTAIDASSSAVIAAAQARFGGLCGITVIPRQVTA
jgi:hypothetical protein